MQAIHQVTYVIRHVANVKAFTTAIARIDDFLEILEGGDDLFVLWQRAMSEMIDGSDFGIGSDNTFCQARQLFF